MQSVSTSAVKKGLALGSGCGLFLAVLPFDFYIFIVPLLFILLLIRSHIAFAITIAVCVVAACLPIKPLDRHVGPFSYASMPVEELAQALRDDWKIHLFVRNPRLETNIIAFSIDHPMSRQAVLEKFATETDTNLRIRKCAYGGTLLFGCSSAAYLRPE